MRHQPRLPRSFLRKKRGKIGAGPSKRPKMVKPAIFVKQLCLESIGFRPDVPTSSPDRFVFHLSQERCDDSASPQRLRNEHDVDEQGALQ